MGLSLFGWVGAASTTLFMSWPVGVTPLFESALDKCRCPLGFSFLPPRYRPLRVGLGPRPRDSGKKALQRLWIGRNGYGAGFDLAADSNVSLTHSELVFPACLAAASISSASEAVTRQYNRPAREEPFGNGGLPILGFFGIGSKIVFVGTESH